MEWTGPRILAFQKSIQSCYEKKKRVAPLHPNIVNWRGVRAMRVFVQKECVGGGTARELLHPSAGRASPRALGEHTGVGLFIIAGRELYYMT